MEPLAELKFNIREFEYPYFQTDEELQFLLDKYDNDIELASYHALLMKAEDDSIKIPGLDYKGSKEYFLRLARKFRPSCNGVIRRADDIL